MNIKWSVYHKLILENLKLSLTRTTFSLFFIISYTDLEIRGNNVEESKFCLIRKKKEFVLNSLGNFYYYPTYCLNFSKFKNNFDFCSSVNFWIYSRMTLPLYIKMATVLYIEIVKFSKSLFLVFNFQNKTNLIKILQILKN